MSAPLFYEVRSSRLAMALRATLNDNYAGRVVERTGIIMGPAEIMVSSQRYDLNSAGSTLVVGGAMLVQNIGRPAAAVYAPVRGGGTVAIGGGGGVYTGGKDTTVKPDPWEESPGSGTLTLTAGVDIGITGSTISRLGNLILLYSGNGIPLQEFALTAAGLAAASAAATAGDMILLPPITLAGDYDLTAGVHYVGTSRYSTILTGQITAAAAASLEHLSITRSASDATTLAALVGPVDGACYVTDCELSATQAGAGTGYAISVQSGDVYVYDSGLYGSTALTDEA